ncbi:uncharacterized protein TNCV_3884001 [Trichonephila clavipes]|nr:uncharacterized protein TNCV_3884001 [Trichonephila clavipes]
MRPLKDADKNPCVSHKNVHHDHSQTADKAKFTLVPTATSLLPAYYRDILQRCLNRSGWNYAVWGRIVPSDEFRFQLCFDDHQRHVWRRSWQRADLAFPIAHAAYTYVSVQFLPHSIHHGTISVIDKTYPFYAIRKLGILHETKLSVFAV